MVTSQAVLTLGFAYWEVNQGNFLSKHLGSPLNISE